MQGFFHCVRPPGMLFSVAEGAEKKKVGNPVKGSPPGMGCPKYSHACLTQKERE